MTEAGITTEIRKGLGRLFGERKPEAKKDVEIDSGQAFDNFMNRLVKSQDRTAKRVGEHLEDEYRRLVEGYKKQKAKDPKLTPKEFLESKGRSEYQPHLVPGQGWDIGSLERDKVREKRNGMDTHILFEILGEPWNLIEKRFGYYEEKTLNHNDSFAFAVKSSWGGVEDGLARFQGRFASLKKEGEKESGVKLWIKEEVESPKGTYYMHKGAVRGFALEISWETEVKWLSRAEGQTVSQK